MFSLNDDEERKKREAEFDRMFGNNNISSDDYTQRANEFDSVFGHIQNSNSLDTPINTGNNLSEVEKNKALGIDENFTNEYSEYLNGMDDRAKRYFYESMTAKPQENNIENKEINQEDAHNEAIRGYKDFKKSVEKFNKESIEKAKQKEDAKKQVDIAINNARNITVSKSKDNTLQKARTTNLVSDTDNLINFEESNTKLYPTLQKAKENSLEWYQKIFKKSDVFDDGYNTGDISKTVLASTADLALGITKGVASVGVGIGKLFAAGIAQVIDFAGDKEKADKIRNNIATEEAPIIKSISELQDKIDNYSIFAVGSDNTAESIGYTSGLLVTTAIRRKWSRKCSNFWKCSRKQSNRGLSKRQYIS